MAVLSTMDPVVIELVGEYDVARKEAMRAELAAGETASFVVLDMTAVNYLDSTALSELLRLRRLTTVHNGVLRVVLKDSAIRRLFAITGIDKTIGVYDELAAALEDPA